MENRHRITPRFTAADKIIAFRLRFPEYLRANLFIVQ